MKKFFAIFVLLLAGLILVSCTGNKKPDDNDDKNPPVDVEEEPITIAEVIKKEELAYVEFIGIVIGYDKGMRHVILEDKDGGASIQLYRNPGFPMIKVGDEVLVKGYRMFDRSTNRVAPEDLEVLSRENESSFDNPKVIDVTELKDWTNDNRINEEILFRVYKFTNVEVTSTSDAYTYIDHLYDEEGGRGLKLGFKNDSSIYNPEKLILGQKYNITTVLYGSSDDFFDEDIDGTVLRLSILHEDHVELVNEGEDALVAVTGARSFLVGESSKPNFSEYFAVVDPVDGNMTITEDMITDNVNMDVAGDYEVTLTITNSEGHTTVETINVFVTVDGKSVTQALNSLYEDLHVKGIVAGYGLNKNNSGSKRAMIIEDPTNGNAIEIWATANSYKDLNIGDEVLIYSELITLEKGLPRLDKTTVIKTISTNNELTAPVVIEDLEAWTTALADDQSKFFGRYTFSGEVLEISGSYTYFTKSSGPEYKVVQFTIHDESPIKYDWVLGQKYEVTVSIYGISDIFTELETKSIAIRSGVMNTEDIKLINEDEDLPVVISGKTVTQAVQSIGENMYVQGVVSGFGVNSNGKSAITIQDPLTGKSIEIWVNKKAEYKELLVGDLILVYSENIKLEKGLPRLDKVTFIEKLSSGNALIESTLIEDLNVWTKDLETDQSNFFGRYTFRAEVLEITSGYVYFTREDENSGNVIQFAVHSETPVKIAWILGETYDVTVSIYGISDAFTALSSKSITIRSGVMHENDVSLVVE